MFKYPDCPSCQSEYTYEVGGLYICPECHKEWSNAEEKEEISNQEEIVFRDTNGNPLTDGDAVAIIKDLKVKGSSSTLKIGTIVKNIKLVDGDHNIDCKIDGFGQMKLKSQFVKKL